MQHSPVMEARTVHTVYGRSLRLQVSQTGRIYLGKGDLHLHYSLLVAHYDIKEGKGRMTFRDICNVCQNRLLIAKDWRRRMSKRMNSGQDG